MLIEIKKVEFKKDGTEKYKYIFLNAANEALIGWNDDKLFASEVYDAEAFDANHARPWEVQRDVYEGKLTLRVVVT